MSQEIQFSKHSTLPEPVTNNAVCFYELDGQAFLLSFAGIDSTKECGATHHRSFRYDLSNGEAWERIEDLPDSQIGKIGIGASQVGDLVYIVGGYTVSNNCNEVSSRRIHRYDPIQNIYLDDGVPIPRAIDDHVQAVYKDRYIYIVTGWSNTTNVTDVQIYDTQQDIWLIGTSVPNNRDWRVFGASGIIHGDTIYYAGGASYICSTNNCFSATNWLRKGAINPADPTQIEWIGVECTEATGYRMGVISYQENPMWLGGSELTYNFDGIDYNESGGVSPSRKTSMYNIENQSWKITQDRFPAVMDHRGVADARNLGADNAGVYIIGGMLENQKVSDIVFKLQIEEDISSVDSKLQHNLRVYPTIVKDDLFIQLEGKDQIQISGINGDIVLNKTITNDERLSMTNYESGVYFVSIILNKLSTESYRIIKL